MAYGIKVVDFNTRKLTIENLVSVPNVDTFETYDVFPDKSVKLPVIQVSIDLPLYRMNNGRTQSDQLLAIDVNNFPDDYFSSGQENVEAQERQHSFLVNEANKGVEDKITPIIQVLREGPQTDPILVSPEGVVLNGNRRLAAMRELFSQAPEEYRRYSTVKAAVLPPLTPDQEMEIEVRLQMTPQTKLDYSWVNEGLMIERLENAGKDRNQIAKLMNVSTRRVNTTIRALQEGRLYLERWLGRPNAFQEILKMRQLFFDLGDILSKKSGAVAEATRKVAWTITNEGAEFEGRLYDLNFIYRDKIPELIDRVNIASPITGNSNSEKDDFDFESDADVVLLQNFANNIHNTDDSENLRNLVIETAQQLDNERRAEDSARNPLNQTQKANVIIASLSIDGAAIDTLNQIEGQLDAIAARIIELKKLIQLRKK